MAARMPVEAKVGAWYTAYVAVRDELTPPRQREAAVTTGAEDRWRVVSANDRTAALVAAIIVGSGGVRPITIEEDV